jgi:hypothetical protein
MNWVRQANCTEFMELMKTNVADKTARFTPMFLDFLKTQLLSQAFTWSDVKFCGWWIIVSLLALWTLMCVMAAAGVRRMAMPLILVKTIAVLAFLGFATWCRSIRVN